MLKKVPILNKISFKKIIIEETVIRGGDVGGGIWNSVLATQLFCKSKLYPQIYYLFICINSMYLPTRCLLVTKKERNFIVEKPSRYHLIQVIKVPMIEEDTPTSCTM